MRKKRPVGGNRSRTWPWPIFPAMKQEGSLLKQLKRQAVDRIRRLWWRVLHIEGNRSQSCLLISWSQHSPLCFSFGESLLAETANDDARLLRDRLASCFADLFASPRLETISYSQFKTLAKKGLLSNVVIGESWHNCSLKRKLLKDSRCKVFWMPRWRKRREKVGITPALVTINRENE